MYGYRRSPPSTPHIWNPNTRRGSSVGSMYGFGVILTKCFGVGVSCCILYSFVVYLYVSGSGSITSVGGIGAGMSIPKMSTPIMSIPKMSIPIMSTVPKCLFPLCLLCQNVYSQNVYYLGKKIN